MITHSELLGCAAAGDHPDPQRDLRWHYV